MTRDRPWLSYWRWCSDTRTLWENCRRIDISIDVPNDIGNQEFLEGLCRFLDGLAVEETQS